MTIATLRETGESTETAVPFAPFFTVAGLLVLSVGILLLAIPRNRLAQRESLK